jgi:homoserine O-acetyltransferase
MTTQGVGIVATQYFHSTTSLPLAAGDCLPEFTVAYETYGTLNAARDNAILLLHALSGDAHAAGLHHPNDRKPGWWDAMVGPGRAFDTNQFFVICSNVLGGCKGSTGPTSRHPQRQQRWACDFPVITIADMVNAQVQLIDSLGIAQLHAVAGGSMGGFQAIEWMAHHAERVQTAVLFATSASSQAQAIAWNVIGRQAIMRDPKWMNGWYDPSEPPYDGLAVARMIGHITYLSDQSLQGRFDQRYQQGVTPRHTLAEEFTIESYLGYQALRFNERFDANSYLYITKAMDYWDVTTGYASLAQALAAWQKPTLVLSFDSDWLYPTAESQKIVAALHHTGAEVTFHELSSPAGHDAFLIESDLQNPIVRQFLRKHC